MKGRPVPRPATPAAKHSPVGAIYNVARNLYVIPGGGGNTAVFVTASGVILVDTKYEDSYDGMMAQVRSVTDKPIAYVINTHFHSDHSGGNNHLPPSTEIIVQERTAATFDKIEAAASMPKRSPGHRRTYRDTLTILSGEDAVDLYYFGPAHTAGDTFVVFRAAGVMHAGDVFPGKAAPIVNINWGGNGVTYADALSRARAGIHGVNAVITGHGAVLTWAAFVEYGEFYQRLLDHVRASARSGRDRIQAFKSLALPEKFKTYKLDRALETMDEIDRSLRPRWVRALPPFLSRYLS
jgi:cyclase